MHNHCHYGYHGPHNITHVTHKHYHCKDYEEYKKIKAAENKEFWDCFVFLIIVLAVIGVGVLIKRLIDIFREY